MSRGRFIFLGAPGVGKGTFAKIISKRYELQHISLGDVLRKHVEECGELGKRVESYLKVGKLVPDAIVNEIVTTALLKNSSTALSSKGFILDGYPRTLSQAQFLDAKYTIPQKTSLTAINITLDRAVTIEKLLGRRLCRTCGGSFNTAHIMERGYDMPAILPDKSKCTGNAATGTCQPIFDKRDDDTEEIIRVRLKDYDQSIQEILDYYNTTGRLKTFDVKKGIKDTDDLWKLMIS